MESLIARLQQENEELRNRGFFTRSYESTPESETLEKGLYPVYGFVEENSYKDEKSPLITLIESENLAALIPLNLTHQEKIDVIYIDPPYNTGNSGFSYKDSRRGKGKNIEKHSPWLSFMEKRLFLAKNLLSEEGVIFVSIDDNEHAYLKVLMDSIFGEENFIGDFIRKTRTSSNDSKTGVNIQHENCLAYAKGKGNVILRGEEKDLSKYKNPDNDPNGDWVSDNPTAASGNENAVFPVINPYTGKVDYPPKGSYWRFSKNTLHQHIESGRITFKKTHKPNERGFIWKRYANNLKSQHHMVNTLDFAINDYNNSVGTKKLRSILDEDFTAPKPVSFLKALIRSHPNPNAKILDFFAGSGTTAEAVLELNKEDGGNRETILITHGFENGKNIAETITAERLRRVITGKNWADGKEHEPLRGNLKYYRLFFTGVVPTDDGMSSEFSYSSEEYDKFLSSLKETKIFFAGIPSGF